MIDISGILNYSTITLIVAFSSLGVAIGETLISMGALAAIYIQPKARTEIIRTSILGMALTETAAIIGLVLGILLLISRDVVVMDKFYWGISNLGIAFAVSISAFVIGIVSSFPVKYACLAISRQPFMSTKILNIMMLTLSFIQTPIIFGFIISLFINYQAASASNLTDSIKYIASGISIGIGSIGPSIGLALFSKSACQAIGYNKDVYNKILTFTFVSEALIETPVVFALVTSLLILTTNFSDNFLSIVVILSAALCTGISNIMPGITSGKTASVACKQIAANPETNSVVTKTSMLAQGLIDSFAIYGWLVSLLLIFFVK